MADKAAPAIRGRSQITFTRGGPGVGRQKMLIFVNVHKAENVNGRRKVVKKSQKHVNVVCEQPQN